MPQAVRIASFATAFDLMKDMQAQGLEWGESYRALGRDALAGILRGQMGADRRNGSYRRHLLTELGAIELAVPAPAGLHQLECCGLMPVVRSTSTG